MKSLMKTIKMTSYVYINMCVGKHRIVKHRSVLHGSLAFKDTLQTAIEVFAENVLYFCLYKNVLFTSMWFNHMIPRKFLSLFFGMHIIHTIQMKQYLPYEVFYSLAAFMARYPNTTSLKLLPPGKVNSRFSHVCSV